MEQLFGKKTDIAEHTGDGERESGQKDDDVVEISLSLVSSSGSQPTPSPTPSVQPRELDRSKSAPSRLGSWATWRTLTISAALAIGLFLLPAAPLPLRRMVGRHGSATEQSAPVVKASAPVAVVEQVTPTAAPPSRAPSSPPPAPTALEPASLRVVTTPPGATLLLDGKELRGTTPMTLAGLTASSPHVIVARHRPWHDAKLQVQLAPGEAAERTLKLTRDEPRGVRAPPVAGRGTLVVAATPWCEVTVDGIGVGPTPLKVELTAGTHRVRLVNPDFHVDRSATVLIRPQQIERKRFEFPTAPRGTVAGPDGATFP
jgi:hypothetical protein